MYEKLSKSNIFLIIVRNMAVVLIFMMFFIADCYDENINIIVKGIDFVLFFTMFLFPLKEAIDLTVELIIRIYKDIDKLLVKDNSPKHVGRVYRKCKIIKEALSSLYIGITYIISCLLFFIFSIEGNPITLIISIIMGIAISIVVIQDTKNINKK